MNGYVSAKPIVEEGDVETMKDVYDNVRALVPIPFGI